MGPVLQMRGHHRNISRRLIGDLNMESLRSDKVLPDRYYDDPCNVLGCQGYIFANALLAGESHSHDPCEGHWKAMMWPLGLLNGIPQLRIMYKGKMLFLSLYSDADIYE